MQYLEGKLHVLHNPKFSVFTDDNGVGRERVELIEQTNPKPWALDWNDHVPANFRLAMDGRFYVAVGDKGLYQCKGRDGSEVNLHGGGILRLRPDGTDLEIFSTGVRNILDVALTAEDELFTYDNTDEHQWMGRLTHMVDGGFYGYPHDFIPRRPYTLWMMHDFGAGAATGALAYNEDALPAEYHGNLFLADFGKRQVTRVRIEREGATFRVVAHEDLFREVPEDFRPVGLAWSPDGLSLYICDWQHRDVKVKSAEVGRLWKLTWTGTNQAKPRPDWWLPRAQGRDPTVSAEEMVAALSHPSHAVRMTAQRALLRRDSREAISIRRRLNTLLRRVSAPAPARWHALWALDALDGGRSARRTILNAATDVNFTVARQAIRQLGRSQVGAAVPVLIKQLGHGDASIRFQAATALGRIGATNAVPALLAALDETDHFTRYAVFTALNRLGRSNPKVWSAIAAGLASANPSVREGASFALRETFDTNLVAALVRIVNDRRSKPEARESALAILAILHHQPPEWRGEWWAYHPAKAARPERTVEWAGTAVVLDLLRANLANTEPGIRRIATEGLAGARDGESAPALRDVFSNDADATVRRAALAALVRIKDTGAAPLIAITLTQPGSNADWHRAAIEALAELRATNSVPVLVGALRDSDAGVRQATIAALGKLGGPVALDALRAALRSAALDDRRAAVRALAGVRDKTLVPDLLAAWQTLALRAEALTGLARLSDLRALEAYLEGLASADPAVRDQCRQALAPIRAELLAALANRSEKLSPPVIVELRRVFASDPAALQHPALASASATPEPAAYEHHAVSNRGDPVRGQRVFFDETGVACIRCHAVAGIGGTVGPDLTLAGAQFSRAQLAESILYPSRAVREGYQQLIVDTKDGESVSGALKADTADGVTLVDARGQTNFIPRAQIAERRTSELSLMPEGLHVGLSLGQFADLVAYMEARTADPRVSHLESPSADFSPLLENHSLNGWREVPAGTRRVEDSTLGSTPQHWHADNGILEHDGKGGDLWTAREFGDFELRLEWRWPDAPKWEQFPVIGRDSFEAKDANGKTRTERVLDAGDSGVLLRGLYKAQANLFCYPVGSGEVWEFRTDLTLPDEVRRGVTPKTCADAPVGDWNRMIVTLRGDRLTVALNEREVIANAQLPGLPQRGPIGLQHEHGRVQFRNVFVRELK
jgi:putative heme-binding domain-containing protein